MRTISSTGSASQGMKLGGKSKVELVIFILSYRAGDRGPARRSRERRDSRGRVARSLTGTYTTHPTMTPNGKVKIPTKVPLFVQQLSHLSYLISLSSTKKISYNAIILALTVLFWCAAVSLLLTTGLSSWSYRDVGTTQMTRHPRKTSMTH